MIEKIKTGGPALPIQGGWGLDSTGVTFRDIFALSVLPAVYSDYAKEKQAKGLTLQSFDEDRNEPSIDAEMIAKDAYSIADAMLNERWRDRDAGVEST